MSPGCERIYFFIGIAPLGFFIWRAPLCAQMLKLATVGFAIKFVGPGTNGSRNHLIRGARDERTRQSEIVAQRYIRENFEVTDWLAVVVGNRVSGETLQRVTTAEQIASPEFQSWLRYKNAHGSDIYLSLNTFNEHAHGRTKEDVKQIRHLYLDLDKEGQQRLAAIHQNPAMPHPNYVLQTSADKYQVI
jgi:hypothetical protein